MGGVDIMGKNAGRLVDSLKAAGYRPEQIDLLIPTHMHFDHISGLTRNGKRVFPNATLLLAAQEKGFWLDKNINELPEPVRGLATLAREAVAPYATAESAFLSEWRRSRTRNALAPQPRSYAWAQWHRVHFKRTNHAGVGRFDAQPHTANA